MLRQQTRAELETYDAMLRKHTRAGLVRKIPRHNVEEATHQGRIGNISRHNAVKTHKGGIGNEPRHTMLRKHTRAGLGTYLKVFMARLVAEAPMTPARAQIPRLMTQKMPKV